MFGDHCWSLGNLFVCSEDNRWLFNEEVRKYIQAIIILICTGQEKYINFSLHILFERYFPPINVKSVVIKLWAENHHGNFGHIWLILTELSTNVCKTLQRKFFWKSHYVLVNPYLLKIHYLLISAVKVCSKTQ